MSPSGAKDQFSLQRHLAQGQLSNLAGVMTSTLKGKV